MALARVSPGLATFEFRTARVTTGTVQALGVAAVTITFSSPFADTNYTATVSVEEATGNGTATLRVRRIISRTAAAISVSVENADTVARTGTLHVTAVHD